MILPSAPGSACLTLLEREWQRTEFTAADGVPPRLWERAVHQPLRDFFARPGKEFRARLTELAWELADPTGPLPADLPLVVELIHAGSLVVDDIQDDSTHRRGAAALHRVHGMPLAINSGSSLYFWPFAVLAELKLPPAVELDLCRRMTRAMLRCHHGQALDLEARIGDLAQEEIPAVVAAITDLKTASLMELAAALGAVAAGAEPTRVADLERFGSGLGVGLQMLNDIANLTGAREPHKRHEDLCQSRPTWPWAWLAKRLDPAQFARLQSRAARVMDRGDDPDDLADELLELLGPLGRRTAHDHLARTLVALRQAIGGHPAVEHAAGAIDRLERAYAGG